MRITYYEETDSAVIWLRDRGLDTEGVIAGEALPDPTPDSIVLHRDDAGELYGIEIYAGASKRLDLDHLDFERILAGATAERANTTHPATSR
jgi:uncharacterized protein YuzE